MTTTARRGKTTGIPFRQERAPVPLAIPAGMSEPDVVAKVARSIYEIARARGCCAYVFVRAGKVYVLSEESGAAHRWAINYTAEWVGCYGGLVDKERLSVDLQELLPLR